MELSGVVSRRIPCLPCTAGAGCHRARPLLRLRRGNFGRVSMRSGFHDDGHVKYYSDGARCGGGGKAEKEVEKEVEKEAKKMKKKLKSVKGLYKELSMFSRMDFGIEGGSGLVEELQGKRISEAAEVLLAQLEQLKAREKEMKRKRKQEKAKVKAERMNLAMDSDSSSSSSSSDSEGDEVVDMNRLRSETPAQKPAEQPLLVAQAIAAPSLPSTSLATATEIGVSPSSNAGSEPVKKIEVCMGGKCRKSGGPALLEELQRAVGIEGAVVGCKCMGKCRDGPNVRVFNGARYQMEGKGDASVTVSAPLMNPLCIGVGLEDVGLIVSNFLGMEQNDIVDIGDLSPATA